MITSEPIGDWTWDVTSDEELRPFQAAEAAVTVWNVLESYGLAQPTGRVSVSARSADEARDVRVQAVGLPLAQDPLSPDTALSRAMTEVDSLEGEFVVGVRVECPGYWLESGVRHRAEKLFAIQVDIWKSSLLVVTLHTYADAWLTMDTRGREQPDIHAANAPRLAGALQGISRVFGVTPTPGAMNRHATPSAEGFEDPRIEGPAYTDSWGTFEVAERSRLLRSRIPDSEDEYEEITDHPVRYFTVRREGRTLVYVWASLGDDAAGYEPRTAAGEEAFRLGAAWLLRLRTAHGQGLAPLAALAWLAQSTPASQAGEIVEDTPQDAPSLDFLEELSGRY
ncbi:hypothetical protein ACIQ6Y_09285 [Streptomyces sp. NPDC096205]|uniref:hypothetical protein n=1 Tax=Streptomyces sp. NPDC096205 TaxID=3366081 RepID=UPI0037F859BA